MLLTGFILLTLAVFRPTVSMHDKIYPFHGVMQRNNTRSYSKKQTNLNLAQILLHCNVMSSGKD